MKVRKKMKTKKQSKNQIEVSQVNVVDAVNATKHNAFDIVDFFNNVKEVNHVVSVDMSRLQQIDVMRLAFIDVVKSLVRRNIKFTLMSRYVYDFYTKTNDRSKSQKLNKYTCKHDKCNKDASKKFDISCLSCENCIISMSYAIERTEKQLRDVLKLTEFTNKFNKILTVTEYKSQVK
jgi:hypothetical protein